MPLSIAFLVGLVGAVATPFLAARSRVLGAAAATLVPAALFAYLLTFVGAVQDGPILEVIPWAPSLGVELTLRIDGFSLLFALLITGIGTLVTLYACAYMAEKPGFERGQFVLYILLFMMAMLGAVTADNLIALFVYWELTSLLSFLLVGFSAYDEKARKAALQSLLVTAGGGLALLAGIILIGVAAGTLSITALLANPQPLVESPLLPAIVVLVLLGAFTKSAQFPFHFWLPNAMKAPTPASAYLHSATMVKLGVYLLARLDPVFEEVAWIGATLVVFGGATMLIAAVRALREVELKAVLALSTVAALGTLVMLIGLPGAPAAVAVVGFILAHALYKAALFFSAGLMIRATGEVRLRRMSGLAASMPFTAAAATLASLSMAGLPPFVGFIAKEYLFEAKLEASVATVGLGLTVLVNAVMVAVAAAIVLRPFFGRARAPTPVVKPETPALVAGPLLLAIAGAVIGLAPNLVMPIIAPAAAAVHGANFDVSFKLWHGLTPMLALSALVVVLGAALIAYWNPIHIALRRRRALGDLLADRGYTVALAGTLALANRSTRILQNGDLRLYAAVTAAFVIGLLAYGLAAGEGGLLPPAPVDPVRPYLAIVCALIALGAVAATIARSLIAATVSVGLSGYGLALVFLMNGGPDLALTQFAVETLFVIIIVGVLLKLPTSARSTRTPGERWFDGALSAAFAASVLIATLWVASKPFDPTLTEWFAQTSAPEAFGRNVVNVILVDFRALDTFGEIAVVAFAALAAWTLLGRRGPSSARRQG